jgi:hypothetical protein
VTRLAETPPTHCSSCFGQYPERRHVDFQAAWDGPVIHDGVMTDDGVTNRIPVSIDELVICEECLTHGAKLLGLKEGQENKRLLDSLAVLAAELEQAKSYIATLEQAVAAKKVAA